MISKTQFGNFSPGSHCCCCSCSTLTFSFCRKAETRLMSNRSTRVTCRAGVVRGFNIMQAMATWILHVGGKFSIGRLVLCLSVADLAGGHLLWRWRKPQVPSGILTNVLKPCKFVNISESISSSKITKSQTYIKFNSLLFKYLLSLYYVKRKK